MKTLEEKIAVMQAELDGKEVEFVYKGDIDWNLKKQGTPFNWQHFDYRVKPEEPKPEYVPYETEAEYLQAAKEHGPYLKVQFYWTVPLVSATKENTIELLPSRTEIRFENLLNFIWQDGTHCGKLVVN